MADDGSQQRKPDFRTAVKDVKALATLLVRELESVLGRRTAWFLGALGLFAVVAALLDWYIAPSSAEQKQALVVTLAQILGGAALLLGLYFTWRTLQVSREGQITERFTRAIDQLGKTDNKGGKLYEIRVGGIYALERIATESERDYWPVMEVLTAYVRQHAKEGTTIVSRPDPDIQAIMTVLRRRTGSYHHGEPEPIDLRRTHLTRAHLYKADFSGAILWDANLERAELREANLSRAYLRGASLHGARLEGADLQGADLQGAHVTDEQLASTLSLQGATMPNGQKYEDWLKDKNGHKADG